ncbi:hypothetical protein BU17DRAFT_97948 [Hysterangium stoloniferum]|nr:hypothetical protein BU17DRAFT_97948 [Hysterangium stoloniferum]
MSVARSTTRKRRFSRTQLESHLKILKVAVAAPFLPHTLPTSPPTSRISSPAPSPSARRKLPPDANSSAEQSASKRPRTSLQQTDVHQSVPPEALPSKAAVHPHPHPSPRNEEDVRPVASMSVAPPPAAILATAPTPGGPEPVSFPHRRGKPNAADFTRFHERYSANGKYLKYSAEIRGQAGQDHQRKLNSPPAPGSAYAVNASLFSRIEAVDALLNFTYAMWCKDMVENKCHHGLWDTIDQFLKWVRIRWETSETRGESQRAFIGIIRMVEAYIYARKAAFLNTANAKRFGDVDKMNKPPAVAPASSISPATSLGGSSSHSAQNGSPAAPSPLPTNGSISSTSRPSVHPHPHTGAGTPSSHPHSALPSVTIPKDLYESLQASQNCNARSSRAMSAAALYISLPVLSRCFPRTAARLQTCQLRPDEEYEVDFDQDECSRVDGASALGLGGDPSPGPGEGQLMWPGALNAHGGEGVAWVCLLGRAMIREMGYPLGYRGLEGLVRKDALPR